ncbi:Lacal_2735 family protein [Yeosuana sp. MJ-SS3]|jgi:hypothetical protein|uniref:Lacal_2735 family protein n=1 Tax=Gilvirhabdus luticola TaxID=3079858 RepID=A0ABU3U7H5_9FLAO|nr:Lacal_2735 family protein [Yeosuana sp. MJ-SS3]MDU8886360.1 Lacal_2735 family protein [Yeosuana sp. MJ-SS3]
MFSIFKKKSKSEKLQEEYNKLMSEWHKLSTINRSKSDEKYAEAEKILEKIELLKPNEN